MVCLGTGSIALGWSHLAVSITFGTSVFLAIMIFQPISGAHINPAVSIAFAVNGDLEKSSPHVLNITFLGVEGESLRLAISDIAISAGSACNSESTESSHVLSILGLSETLANSSIRFSFGRFTKFSEIDYVIERIKFEVNRLRSIMGKTPKWCRS